MDLKEDSNKLLFYKRMYDAFEKLNRLYKNGFNLTKMKVDIVTDKFVLNRSELAEEYKQLVALESIVLSTMIGLNKEKLEQANSETKNKSLFQYKDYESDMLIFYGDGVVKEGHEAVKEFASKLKFNEKLEGPFPYILEIIKDDNKKRPYDYIAKIRNALLHAEYCMETPEILHITNHDEDGNLTFEGKLFIFSLAMFVKDFFGIKGVSSSFTYYNQLPMEKLERPEQLVTFLYNYMGCKIKFKQIPEKYKFNGKEALFSRLMSCFGIDNVEIVNICEELEKLKEEGFEYNYLEQTLDKYQILNTCLYLHNRYNLLFKNHELINNISSLVKLMFNPIDEITNCLDNILTYISLKKDYLINEEFSDKEKLEELKYDEYCDVAFQYTLSILKANIINYAIECSEFEDIDFSLLDESSVKIINTNEFNRRKNNLIKEGVSIDSVDNMLILQTIRNALAHGNDRLDILIDETEKVILTDIYPNISNLGLEISLENLNKILSSDIFSPDNIRTKEEKKLIKK